MMSKVRRIFVEKKKGFGVAAQHLFVDCKDYLGIKNLKGVRILIRYDIEGISDKDYQAARTTIFSEPPVDKVYDETIEIAKDETMFAIEYLPGQYDQRADSAAQCIQIMSHGRAPDVKAAQAIILKGKVSDNDVNTVKKYLINPVDSHEAALEKPETLKEEIAVPEEVETFNGFTTMSNDELERLRKELGLAMSQADLQFIQKYFLEEEKRDPTITEIRMLDTYWSDHCRHTTFLTRVKEVKIADSPLTAPIKKSFEDYQKVRKFVYGDREKPMCLMDIANMRMKEMRKKGELDDLELSDEINACTVVVEAELDGGRKEEWLVLFKNETHNHPTEIEPFGGAATCLGGAIRDPLSGRSYVYQAMRVTGCGDPRKTLAETLPGKLPQRKISVEAAHGYSSYGNQIGLATGIVSEIYNEGYIAKRMEIGAVIGAAPRKNVIREKPVPGDVVILVGGRTGRDGCGGATGSSKAHTEESIITCGAEVQKGNPPTERKIQRLFRNPEVSRMIKKCNDFGAGGVSISVGELADGLFINLDAVPKKYEGLDGTELAISESQERMSIMVDKNDVDRFIQFAREENLEATPIATVTDGNRVRMVLRGRDIVNISREFIDTNGVIQDTVIEVVAPNETKNPLSSTLPAVEAQSNLELAWLANLADLNVCSQRGLVERFDSTIGAGSVLLPFGGRYQITPAECMVAKLPVLEGDTVTGTVMSYGFDPNVSTWSPFHGAVYSVVEAVSKVVAAGGDHRKIRMTLQEYFEKLLDKPERWGKPFSALLGAFHAQEGFGIPAVGGKDSMSGTFENIHVPPTLVAFAVCPTNVNTTISPEFKKSGNHVVYIPCKRGKDELPDFEWLNKQYELVTRLIKEKKIISAHTVRTGGIAATVTKMAFGNRIGMEFTTSPDRNYLFGSHIGSLVCEVDSQFDPDTLFTSGEKYKVLGKTTDEPSITINGTTISLDKALKTWESTLEPIFPTKAEMPSGTPAAVSDDRRNTNKPKITIAKPHVLVTIFPGTNCEYDSARAFERAGGIADQFIIKNLTPQDVNETLAEMAKRIDNSQIIMIPGGFSAGDEPDGSGKFIAAVFRNPAIKDAVMRLINDRDGLMLGICNGFQALAKLGLVPFGEIRDMDEHCPTLTFNTIGRHESQMVRTKIVSTLSPWFANVNLGDVYSLAISHGEGRFIAEESVMKSMIESGQVATQYVDIDGNPSYDIEFNPNGSLNAIEGITSPDGRILGKMGHSERIGTNVAKNIEGIKDQKIFEAGVGYFG